MAHVLLVGTATLDLVFALDHHPAADEEMRAQRLRICRGGNAANSAVVLAQLGHAAEFFGVLAEAPETLLIEQDFAAHGVDYHRCPRLPGRPPTSSIYLSGAQRSIVHYRDLPELDAAQFAALGLHDCGWLHCEGRNVTALAGLLARARAVRPALPVSLELEKPRDGLAALLDCADLLICSRAYAASHGHFEPQAFLHWLAAQAPAATLVLPWGEGGAYALPAGGSVIHAPAQPPVRVVDTLGAGDTFNAGLLAALVDGADLASALARACRLAGEKCGREGLLLPPASA